MPILINLNLLYAGSKGDIILLIAIFIDCELFIKYNEDWLNVNQINNNNNINKAEQFSTMRWYLNQVTKIMF